MYRFHLFDPKGVVGKSEYIVWLQQSGKQYGFLRGASVPITPAMEQFRMEHHPANRSKLAHYGTYYSEALKQRVADQGWLEMRSDGFQCEPAPWTAGCGTLISDLASVRGIMCIRLHRKFWFWEVGQNVSGALLPRRVRRNAGRWSGANGRLTR